MNGGPEIVVLGLCSSNFTLRVRKFGDEDILFIITDSRNKWER